MTADEADEKAEEKGLGDDAENIVEGNLVDDGIHKEERVDIELQHCDHHADDERTQRGNEDRFAADAIHLLENQSDVPGGDEGLAQDIPDQEPQIPQIIDHFAGHFAEVEKYCAHDRRPSVAESEIRPSC